MSGAVVLAVDERSLENLAEVANREHRLALESGMAMVEHAIAAGEALLAAKEKVRGGNWTSWLAENFPGSRTVALNYVRIARNRELLPDRVRNIQEALWLLSSSPATRHGTKTDELPDALTAHAQILHGEGLSYEEIASELGCSPSAVWRRLNPASYRRYRERNNRIRKNAYSALRQAERDRYVRRANGKPGKAYEMLRKVQEELARAIADAESPDVRAELQRAQPALYEAEDSIAAAARLVAITGAGKATA